MKKPNGLFAALRKAITDPVTLAPQPAVPVADAPPLRATAPAPERSKEMILAGKVTQVISGSEYADGKQRIDIRVEDAESFPPSSRQHYRAASGRRGDADGHR